MLLNVSYNDRKIKEQIDKEVGPSFSLRERWKLGGIGSSKLSITHASIDIHNLLVLDNNSDNCNVELRPNGIIIRFRSLLETYGLVIPYYKLKIYKGKANEYSIYKDHFCIKVGAFEKSTHQYFKKINQQKIDALPTPLEEL
tara:strand:+ start:1253 stop:1678 length:426 start_codon:yes stop_codon:yes gene_type:complete